MIEISDDAIRCEAEKNIKASGRRFFQKLLKAFEELHLYQTPFERDYDLLTDYMIDVLLVLCLPVKEHNLPREIIYPPVLIEIEIYRITRELNFIKSNKTSAVDKV